MPKLPPAIAAVTGRQWAAVGAAAATAFVGATAFVLAYGGSKGAAMDAGMPAGPASWYPLCIEGVIVVASIATMVIPKRPAQKGWAARLRPGARFPAWVVLLGFSALSAAANVLHALDQPSPTWWAPVAAAVPPMALPICVRLAERVALSAAARSTTSPAAPVVAGWTEQDRADLDRRLAEMDAHLDSARKLGAQLDAQPADSVDVDALRRELLAEAQAIVDEAVRAAARKPEHSPDWTEAVRLLRESGVSKQTAYNRANKAEAEGKLWKLIADLQPAGS